MFEFRKVNSNISPETIDKTSSMVGVFYRKNIEQEEIEEIGGEGSITKTFYQFDEILLPYDCGLDIDFSLEGAALATAIEAAITQANQNEIKQNRIAEIKEALNELDLKTIRPLRAGEDDRVEQLENQAIALREELSELIGN